MTRRNTKAAEIVQNITDEVDGAIDSIGMTQDEMDRLTAIVDQMDSDEEFDLDEIEFPVYQEENGDRFTADDLFDTNGKQKFYSTPSNAMNAQASGKYGPKKSKVSGGQRGAPRKSGTQVDALTLPSEWAEMSKARKSRWLVNQGVTIGDAARYLEVRYQQVRQAVAYGKLMTND